MNDKNIIKEYLLFKKVSQTELAKNLNYNSRQTLSNTLNSNSRMNIEKFTQMVNSLGGTVKVVDEDSGREWIVSFDE